MVAVYCLPCENTFEIKDAIFQRTAEDDNPGLSREDKDFIQLMEKEMSRSPSGHITAPLPTDIIVIFCVLDRQCVWFHLPNIGCS